MYTDKLLPVLLHLSAPSTLTPAPRNRFSQHKHCLVPPATVEALLGAGHIVHTHTQVHSNLLNLDYTCSPVNALLRVYLRVYLHSMRRLLNYL